MKCPFCDAKVDKNDLFCDNCGKKLPEKKSNWLFMIVLLLLGISIGVFYFFLTKEDEKVLDTYQLKCASEIGSITINYTEKGLVGYSTKTYTYDFDQEKENAAKIGVKTYLENYKLLFEIANNGICAYDEEPDVSKIQPLEALSVLEYTLEEESETVKVIVKEDKTASITRIEKCEEETCEVAVDAIILEDEAFEMVKELKELLATDKEAIDLKELTSVLKDTEALEKILEKTKQAE